MVAIEHVALECDTIDHAKQLYEDLFGCKLVKKFVLSASLSQEVFSINQPIDVVVYSSSSGIFEIFITGKTDELAGFRHVCISVKDIESFLYDCEQLHIETIIVEKNEKRYVFLRDTIGNIFEIKQQ
jgi:catechol 2,3-dioxygenase-like lactoylglutathione lyase family enzyme